MFGAEWGAMIMDSWEKGYDKEQKAKYEQQQKDWKQWYKDQMASIEAKKEQELDEEMRKAKFQKKEPDVVVKTEYFQLVKWDGIEKNYILLSETGRMLVLSPRSKNMPPIVADEAYKIKYQTFKGEIVHVFTIEKV
ncbi:hypothetical protein ACT7CW_06460 [Bacillus pacificus]|nr:hypothetical protein [Bacillus cereus]